MARYPSKRRPRRTDECISSRDRQLGAQCTATTFGLKVWLEARFQKQSNTSLFATIEKPEWVKSCKTLIVSVAANVTAEKLFSRITSVTNADVLDKAFALNVEQQAQGHTTSGHFPSGLGQMIYVNSGSYLVIGAHSSKLDALTYKSKRKKLRASQVLRPKSIWRTAKHVLRYCPRVT